MPRVIHFEIAADDPERAVAFYRKVFGWEIQKWEGPMEYWVITTGPKEEPGIDGGLGRRRQGPPPKARHPRRWLARLLRGYGGEPVRLDAGRSVGKVARGLPLGVVASAHGSGRRAGPPSLRRRRASTRSG